MIADAKFLMGYLPILVFLMVAFGLASAIMIMARFMGKQMPDKAKLSQYECGFDPFDSSRMQFDVRYYLVAILFIIFDLEVAFLFPWSITFDNMSELSFFSMMFFLGVLTIGFVYEWCKGALEWN